MRFVKIVHPDGLAAEVAETAVAQLSQSGWQVGESEEPVSCPACGQTLPAAPPPPNEAETTMAPAESGASSSKAPRRRRATREETE